LKFFLILFLIFYFDEEEKNEESEVYFSELKINPNYDKIDKLISFPFLNIYDAEKILMERERGYFKDKEDFKKRTKIFLPDSIFERYFDFEIKRKRLNFYSYFEKENKFLNKLNFYFGKNSINLLYSKNLYRFSYSFYKKDFNFIVGDYFIENGNGILYGSQGFFYNFSKFFIFDAKYFSSSYYNRGLKGFYISYKNFLFYFSSRNYKNEQEFFERKIGSGLRFYKNRFFFSILIERNFLNKSIYSLNKNFNQISLSSSFFLKEFKIDLEYLPLNNSYLFKFLFEKFGFSIYRLDEKNYDFHSSHISQSFNAKDEIGASIFEDFSIFSFKFYVYTLIYRKISETNYSYKNYFSIQRKIKNFILSFDYKNTFSNYKRERFGLNFYYNILGFKIYYLIAQKDKNFYYGNSIFLTLKEKFIEINYGIFNTQSYYSRIYFYNTTFFPYYDLLPLYGQGNILGIDLNLKLKYFKFYIGFYEIKKDKENINFNMGFLFDKLFP
jgi:hypothetical protein